MGKCSPYLQIINPYGRSLLTSDHLNGRLKRLSNKLQPCLATFQYLPGVENTMADTLSQQDWMAGDADLMLTHEGHNGGGEDHDGEMTAGELLPESDDGRQAGSGGA